MASRNLCRDARGVFADLANADQDRVVIHVLDLCLVVAELAHVVAVLREDLDEHTSDHDA